jgi:protein-tyrosine phosphatase
MTVVDFHSHILPNIDHGCKSIDECAAQLSLMKSAGTQIAVATPHFYPHVHKADTFSERVDASVRLLRSSEIKNAPQLAIGAEVLLCENLDTMDGLSELCIRGTKVLLLELPTEKLRDGHFDTVETLLANGYTVVLAHIDRYIKNYGNDIQELLGMGALAQVNAQALSSHKMSKKIKEHVRSNHVCALGSDLHGVDKALYRHFTKLPKRLGADYGAIMDRAAKLLYDAVLVDTE